jgi:para-aminobenzoate synthetase component I
VQRWPFQVREALRAWPEREPLAALTTGQAHARAGTLSVLAAPKRVHTIEWPAEGAAGGEAAMSELERTLRQGAWFEATGKPCATESRARALALGGLWIVALSYEWGGLVEPRAMPRHRPPPDGWPLATLAWCPAPLVLDHGTGQWHASPAAAALGDELAARAASMHRASGDAATGLAEVTGLDADQPRAAFESAVARTVEYIRAGDIFQANIAQRFSARWSGSPRAVALAAFDAGDPRYGAYLETPTHALASLSPELFVQASRDGRIRTRPIKGTLASHDSPEGLLASEKDAAELHMIVDLMRNDLGRICRPGSVRVAESRALESHATVHHTVAEVEGTLRAGAALPDVLRAAWPPGSVTGAPKVRALQVIDELEPCARGPYCGAIGLVSAGELALNVAIRTLAMHRDAPDATTGVLRYSAGCGIVADSVPRHEYEESLHKTAVMLHTAHSLRRRQPTA